MQFKFNLVNNITFYLVVTNKTCLILGTSAIIKNASFNKL